MTNHIDSRIVRTYENQAFIPAHALQITDTVSNMEADVITNIQAQRGVVPLIIVRWSNGHAWTYSWNQLIAIEPNTGTD